MWPSQVEHVEHTAGFRAGFYLCRCQESRLRRRHGMVGARRVTHRDGLEMRRVGVGERSPPDVVRMSMVLVRCGWARKLWIIALCCGVVDPKASITCRSGHVLDIAIVCAHFARRHRRMIAATGKLVREHRSCESRARESRAVRALHQEFGGLRLLYMRGRERAF